MRTQEDPVTTTGRRSRRDGLSPNPSLTGVRRLLRENGFSLVLGLMFVAALVGQSLVGQRNYNNRTYAQLLGHDKAVKLFSQTLEEEELADEKLNTIAESKVNAEAAAAGGASQ